MDYIKELSKFIEENKIELSFQPERNYSDTKLLSKYVRKREDGIIHYSDETLDKSILISEKRLTDKIKELEEKLEKAKVCLLRVSASLEQIMPVVEVSCDRVTNMDDMASCCPEVNLTKDQRVWINKVYEAYDVIERNEARQTLKELGE